MAYELKRSTAQVFQAIEAAKSATVAKSAKGDLNKGWVLDDDLSIFPVSPEVQINPLAVTETPLRDMIPRRTQVGGTGFGYKIIDRLDSNKTSGDVQEGRRGGFINTAIRDKSFFFKSWGFEDFSSFEAELASRNLSERFNALNLIQTTLTQMVKEWEEKLVIGGNSTVALGASSSISLEVVAEKGSLEAGTVSVISVPLIGTAYASAKENFEVPLTFNRTNADGSTTPVVGGYGLKTTATATVEADGSINFVVADVKAASGYAVFAGAAGSERLVHVGPNYGTITDLPTDTQEASALSNSDQSVDTLQFDGLHSLAANEGGVVVSLDGAKLTVDGTIAVEVENVLKSIKARKVSVTHLVMNLNTKAAYAKAVRGKDASTVVIVNGNGATPDGSGTLVETYTSFSQAKTIPIVLDEHVPDGEIIFYANGTGQGELARVGNIAEFIMASDISIIAWPLITRSYQFGIYGVGVFAHKYPASIGILKNIGL